MLLENACIGHGSRRKQKASMKSELKMQKLLPESAKRRIYEVIHGSKALFGVELIWESRGDGAIYKASFFGRSQVQAV